MSNEYFYVHEADQFTFYRVPKVFFVNSKYKKMSSDAKLLYGLLLDRVGLSIKNSWIDSERRVYIIYTREEAQEMLGLGTQKAVKLFKELKDYGLMEEIRQGLNKPNLIYVKKFIETIENTWNFENQKSEINPGVLKIKSQNFLKSKTNDTDLNDTDSVVVEETTNEELSLPLMKKINDLNFKYKYTFSLNDIDSILDAYSNNLDLINTSLEYMINNEPKKGFKNFVGFLINAKGYKDTTKEIKNEFQAPASNGAYIKPQDKPNKKKTGFHLANSRGDKYTASELEEIILAKSREKIKNIKKE